ncbi:MAG: hypothetical protein AB1353_00550 [Aquificota bacterium]
MKGEGVNLILPLGCGSQLTPCFSNVAQGEDFLSILFGVMEEEGSDKISDNKKQEVLITSFVNVPNTIPPFKVDAPLEFKQQGVVINTKENTSQGTTVQKETKLFVDNGEFIKLPEVQQDGLEYALAFEKAEVSEEVLSFRSDKSNKVITEEFRLVHENTSLKEMENIQTTSLDKGGKKPITNNTKIAHLLNPMGVEGSYIKDKSNQGTFNQKGGNEAFINTKEPEQAIRPKESYLLEPFKNPEPTAPKEFLKPLQPFQKMQLDSKDIPLENKTVEQKVSHKDAVQSLILEDISQKDTLTLFKENAPTWEEHQKVKSEYKEERFMDDLTLHNPVRKEEATPIKQEDTKIESVRRHEPIINHEPKQISIKLDEAFLKLNLLGDKLRLSINLKEEAYRQPTEFEVQRLVQSLQNLGLNLEVLKLNGSMLYYSDQRQNKREDRERSFLSAVSEGNKVSKEEKKSFSLYL